jgi:hypothetical protein
VARQLTRPLERTTHLAIGLLGTSRPFTALHRALCRRLGGRGLVKVQLGERRRIATARTAGQDEHARLWSIIVAGYPGYDAYRDRTGRAVPVVVLEPC